MKHTADCKFAPTGKSRLPDLLYAFGCADFVAPVDEDAFAQNAGELISRKKAETVTPIAGKYRLRALQCEEVAAQTRDPHVKNMLTVAAQEFIQAARQAEKKKRAA